MAYGKLSNDRTKAAKLYAIMDARRGVWINGWELAMAAKTTCIGTRISEVRQQLPSGEAIELKRYGKEHKVLYRLV